MLITLRRIFGCALICAAGAALASLVEDARRARDVQDLAALESAALRASSDAAKQPRNARAQYEAALVYHYLAELATETNDREGARKAAEAGIATAEKSVALESNSAEYHRLLGTLYGQIMPGSLTLALKYGPKAREEIDRAVALDPRSSDAYLSRGIGKFYLPRALGGGPEVALEDLQKAVQLNPKSDQAHLWLGIALRSAKRVKEAREALAQAVKLNPQRVWAKKQLEKTPAH